MDLYNVRFAANIHGSQRINLCDFDAVWLITSETLSISETTYVGLVLKTKANVPGLSLY